MTELVVSQPKGEVQRSLPLRGHDTELSDWSTSSAPTFRPKLAIYEQFVSCPIIPRQDWKERFGHPVWHVYRRAARAGDLGARIERAEDDGLVRDAAEPRRGRQQRQPGGALGFPAARGCLTSPTTVTPLGTIADLNAFVTALPSE